MQDPPNNQKPAKGKKPKSQLNALPPENAPAPPSAPSSTGQQERKRGRGHPPPEYQFPPGVSGNPKGRPRQNLFENDRGNSFVTALVRQFRKKVTITENGREVKITGIELFARRLWADALKEDKASRKFLLTALNLNLRGADEGPPNSELDANMLRNLARAFIDPSMTEEDFQQMEREVEEENARRMREAGNDDDDEEDPGDAGDPEPEAA